VETGVGKKDRVQSEWKNEVLLGRPPTPTLSMFSSSKLSNRLPDLPLYNDLGHAIINDLAKTDKCPKAQNVWLVSTENLFPYLTHNRALRERINSRPKYSMTHKRLYEGTPALLFYYLRIFIQLFVRTVALKACALKEGWMSRMFKRTHAIQFPTGL
jgi:hypothetical protein